MVERDSFELRLAEALRAYTDDAPMDVLPVELVRHLASTTSRGRRAAQPWRFGTAPSMAWLLLLLALLLAATTVAVGAGILRSREPVVAPVVPTAAPPSPLTCLPGTNPNQPGPAGQARPPIPAGPTPMAFDSRAGRIVVLAGKASWLASTETWTFDICTNTWTQMHPNREPPLGAVRQLVYDADSDVTVAIDDMEAWAYDLEGDSWTLKDALPTPLQRQSDLAYDPKSGLILVMSSTSRVETDPWELWTYDVDTDTWTSVRQTGGPRVAPDHSHQWLGYDSSVDRFVWYQLPFGPGGEADTVVLATWLFDLSTGSWSESSAGTPDLSVSWGASGNEMAYDQATRQTVVFSLGRVVAYDAAADRWEILYPQGAGFDVPLLGQLAGPTARWGPSMVYDSVNERLIVYGGSYPTANLDSEGRPIWAWTDDVPAFDPVTRQWTVLLEASAAP